MNVDIGSKIRFLRKQKKMSIAELAEATGLSTGIISQIERDLVSPSIVTFWKISQGLDVSVGYFFEDEHSVVKSPVVKKSARRSISVSNSEALYELLTPDLNREIEFLYITLNPKDFSSKDFVVHEGEECGIVIKGKLMVKFENEEYILEEGDSISFDCSKPHRYINIGDVVCESIWAMTPPNF